MIQYATHPNQKWKNIGGGFLRVANVDSAVVARLILQIPQGDYITREIVSRLALFQLANPDAHATYDLNNVYYTLKDAEPDPDFGPQNFRVPVEVYVALRP